MTRLAVALAILGLAIGVTACGSSRARLTRRLEPPGFPHGIPVAAPPSGLDFGPFAGALATGPLQSVSATFTVPRTARGSAPGLSSTWIGADIPEPGLAAPFIQVGVSESRTQVPLADGSRNADFAFWTDPDHHDRPIFLFAATPGDQIDARLSLSGDLWNVSISDLSGTQTASFDTRDEAVPGFDRALWIQEDPTLTPRLATAQLPDLAGAAFSDLRVNGRAPASATMNVQWMSAGDRVLAPNRLDPAGFRFVYRTPRLSRAARQWLSDIEASIPAGRLIDQAASWTSSTPAETRLATVRSFERLTRSRPDSAEQSWPPAVRPSLRRLASVRDAELRQLLLAPHLPAVAIPAWSARLRSLGLAAEVVSQSVSRLLGAPEVARVRL